MDKIETIRALLLQRIEYHTGALDGLHRKLKQLDEVDAMLPDLADNAVNLSEPKSGQPYSGKSLTEALKAVLIHSAASPRTLMELRVILVRGGYETPKTGNFSASINATLHRLATQGLVTIAEDDDGRKTFVRKI